jgi:hypothetical protein
MRVAAHSEVLRAPVVHVTDPAPPSRAHGARSEARRRLRRARIGRAITAAVVLLASGLAHVWVRLQVTELGYGLNTTGEIVARLEREQRELEAELAMLTAPQHLADEARRRLDMREPEPGQVVVLR